VDLGTLPGGTFSQGVGINPAGKVVGRVVRITPRSGLASKYLGSSRRPAREERLQTHQVSSSVRHFEVASGRRTSRHEVVW
jgi:hypothetical protein